MELLPVFFFLRIGDKQDIIEKNRGMNPVPPQDRYSPVQIRLPPPMKIKGVSKNLFS
jgi:hypothetical protein